MDKKENEKVPQTSPQARERENDGSAPVGVNPAPAQNPNPPARTDTSAQAQRSGTTELKAGEAGKQVKEAEEARQSKAHAVKGAEAVKDAVTKVADAAVKAAMKAPAHFVPEVIFSGVAGGRFEIKGAGFGTNGTVTLNGQSLKTDGWGATRIHGRMPANAKEGEVLINVDEDTQRVGYFKG